MAVAPLEPAVALLALVLVLAAALELVAVPLGPAVGSDCMHGREAVKRTGRIPSMHTCTVSRSGSRGGDRVEQGGHDALCMHSCS